MTRFIFDIVLCVAAIAFPWWVTVLLCATGLVLFRRFVEVVFVGLIVDTLYSTDMTRYLSYHFVTTTVALVAFFSVEGIYNKLRLSHRLR